MRFAKKGNKVTTKAKLDAITVQGNSECGEKSLIELVVVVDGSDSFNNKGFSNLNVFIFT